MKSALPETLFTLMCVAILLGLGTWQIQRLHWKTAIIDKLHAQYDSANGTPLSAKALDALTGEKEPVAYGRIHARLLRDKAVLLGPKTEDGRMGYHLLIPAELPDNKILIINTGWVPDLWRDTLEDRMMVLPVDSVTIKGVLHKPDWSSFASKNSPSNDLWFRADIAELAKAKDLADPYPFILYADSITPPLHDVKPHESNWLPRNKHLQYAIFWYAMGACMVGVYIAYMMSRRKRQFSII